MAMDAGLFCSSRSRRSIYGGRFIPNREIMNMEIAGYLLSEPIRKQNKNEVVSPSREAYRKALRDVLLEGRTRILNFGYKLPAFNYSPSEPTRRKQRRIPREPERVLEAPDLVDDYCINLLDWGSSNSLSIALGNTVYLRNATNGSTSELVTVDEDCGPMTSVSWNSNGRHLAVGLNSSEIQIFDAATAKMVRSLRGIHRYGVGTLAWKRQLLTSGSMDGHIVNYDVRAKRSINSLEAHTEEVYALKWSNGGQHLASGGNDGLVSIWNLGYTRPMHRMKGHTGGVRALAWCPYESHVIASGGGGNDGCIKFWNRDSGLCLDSVNTGSEVCALLWNNNNDSENDKELLSSHGSKDNQLTLWQYPKYV